VTSEKIVLKNQEQMRIYTAGTTVSEEHFASIFRVEPENGGTVLLPTYQLTTQNEILQMNLYNAGISVSE
jgi:hypothetical protein